MSWLERLLGRSRAARPEAPAIEAGGDRAAVRDLVHRGFAHHQAGRLGPAAAAYREVLAMAPGNPDALYLLGVIVGAEGDHEAAADLLERAVAADPEDPNYRVGLAGELRAMGRLDEALEAFAAALEQNPGEPRWLNDYGNTLRLAGRLDAAADAYRRALALAPELADARYNLGGCLLDAGDVDGAGAELERVTGERPELADGHNNLGLVRFHQGRLDDALGCFRRALDRAPDHADAHNNAGLVLQRRNDYEGAVAAYERAIAFAPRDGKAASNLGLAYQELGRYREAIAQYSAALTRNGNDGVRIRQATVLPVIAPSREEIAAMRERLDREVTALMGEPLAIADPATEVGACNFHLAYHGENDRDLQEKTARLHLHACPELAWTAPHCERPGPPRGRLRVGFVTKFMYEHSIGRTTRGLVAELDRDRFEVHALFAPPFVDDRIGRFVRDRSDAHAVLAPRLDAARAQIAERELDVLFFQEIGMDPFTYFLAFARLAPVQCVSFGHPDTTGIPNMDYFVSGDLYEPAGAGDHYSERLATIPDVGTLAYYYRPRLASSIEDRSGFGLDADRNLYLCPQTLFKLHPDFDSILADILRRDPAGEVLLIAGRTPAWARLLEARFAGAIPDVADRIRFLPGYGSEDFLKLIDVCDVMLDPIHFNGMNTSLEAFALGVPVVTLPGALQRGRHTAGMYRRMGIDDAVAADPADYAAIAVGLATDPGARRDLRARILGACDVLFEDAAVVRGFESFFVEARDAAGR